MQIFGMWEEAGVSFQNSTQVEHAYIPQESLSGGLHPSEPRFRLKNLYFTDSPTCKYYRIKRHGDLSVAVVWAQAADERLQSEINLV